MLKPRVFIKIMLAGIVFIASCNLPSEEINGSKNLDVVRTEVASTNAGGNSSESLLSGTAASAVVNTPAPTETPAPKHILNVCLGSEPKSLSFYMDASQSMWSVLESIYDGPFDTVNGKSVPVIFDDISVSEESVQVEKNSPIVNSRGEPVALAAGDVIVPSNGADLCGADGCSLKWLESVKGTELKQMTITYKLKNNLKWSDGTALKASDSVFAFNLNSESDSTLSQKLVRLTESYTATDDQTVVWKGLPGYIPESSASVFWLPLPEHLYTGKNLKTLLTDDSFNRSPVGWGAYKIESWDAGSQIRAVKNEYYSGEKSPYFDEVDYKFLGAAGDNNLAALKNGTCDIIDTSVNLRPNLEPVLEDVRDKKLAVYISPGTVWEQLTFNFAPAYNGTYLEGNGNSAIYRDLVVRQAAFQCINRKQLIRNIFYGQAEIPVGFYPSSHYLADSSLSPVNYDAEAAKTLLENDKWTDADKDPTTPRTYTGNSGLTYNLPLSVTISTSDSELRTKVTDSVKSDLEACGFSVKVDQEPLSTLYGKGPDGILFGRKFDLAEFAWSSGINSPCTLFTTDQIPAAANNWIGVNVGGFSNSDFDTACSLALSSSETDEDYLSKQQAVQKLYADNLPALPLYFDFTEGVSSLNICGLQNTIGARSLLWNIESLSKAEDGSACAVSQWNNIYE